MPMEMKHATRALAAFDCIVWSGRLFPKVHADDVLMADGGDAHCDN